MTDEQISRLERIMEAGLATLADLIRETNSRLDETNSRLDETNDHLGETNERLGQIENRFDSFLLVAGSDSRELRERVTSLEARVDLIEEKV